MSETLLSFLISSHSRILLAIRSQAHGEQFHSDLSPIPNDRLLLGLFKWSHRFAVRAHFPGHPVDLLCD